MKNYTSFSLQIRKAKKPKYWARCLFKKPDGKPSSDWIALQHNGQDLYVASTPKKLAKEVFTQFEADMRRGTPSAEYITEDKTFEQRTYELAFKNSDRHYKAVFDLIESNIDEGFRSKKINQVLNQDYLNLVQESFQKIIDHLEDGELDKVVFPRRRLQPQTVVKYFKDFKTACNKIVKKKRTGYYPCNLVGIEIPKISRELKTKLEEKRKYLSPEQIELVENMPTYQELMENRRGKWKDIDKDYKEAFLFILETGYRSKDISRLKWEHISKQADSNGKLHNVVQLLTHKATKDSFVPVSDDVIEMLPKKRKDSDYVFKLPDTSALRSIEFKRYMRHLKTYMKQKDPGFNVDTNIHFHMARHHFVQYSSSKNISNALIAKMVGCTEQNIAKTYKKITGDDILAVADKVTDKTKKLIRKKEII